MSSGDSDSTSTASLLTLSESDSDGTGQPEASESEDDGREIPTPADPRPDEEERTPEEEEQPFKAEVVQTYSELSIDEALRDTLGACCLSDDKDGKLPISPCDPSESVCGALLADTQDTFYLYADLFTKLNIRLPSLPS